MGFCLVGGSLVGFFFPVALSPSWLDLPCFLGKTAASAKQVWCGWGRAVMCHEIRGWKGATSSGYQEEQVEHLLWMCCALPLADPPCPCACTCAGNNKFHNILSIKWDNNCVQQPLGSHGKWFPCTRFSALLLQILGVCGLCVGQWRLWSQPEKFLAVYSLNEKCCIFLAKLWLFASRENTAPSLVTGKSYRRRKSDNTDRRIHAVLGRARKEIDSVWSLRIRCPAREGEKWWEVRKGSLRTRKVFLGIYQKF